MTTKPDPFDPEYFMSEQFKRDTIAQLRARYEERERQRERDERRRQRLRRLTFGLLGR